MRPNLITKTSVNHSTELPHLHSLNFTHVEDYYYDSSRHSVVMKKDSTCVIVDYNLCANNNDAVFDYSKYCEMQNGLMASSGRLFRFYTSEGEDLRESIHKWLTMEPDDIEISDKGGVFDKVHVDNTPLEKTFEDLFVEIYGNDAFGFLQKEYSLSLSNGRNAFLGPRYVVMLSIAWSLKRRFSNENLNVLNPIRLSVFCFSSCRLYASSLMICG